MSRWSRHSRRTVPTNRSAYAFARGAWIGVLTIRMPVEVNTASNAIVNLASRSRIKNRNFHDPVLQVHQQVPGLLGNPVTGRVRRHTQDVHPAGVDLDHEEDVDAAQQHGVNVEETARQKPGRLASQNLPPAAAVAAWGRPEPGDGQDPSDRAPRPGARAE